MFAAVESLFKGGEAVPGVGVVGALWCDAPEVESVVVFGDSVFYQLNRENTGGVEIAAFVRLGALEIVASLSSVVVKNEAGGKDFAVLFK